MNQNTEIRKLSPTCRNQLALILDVNSSWKHLMGIIPLNIGSEEPKKYSSHDIQ